MKTCFESAENSMRQNVQEYQNLDLQQKMYKISVFPKWLEKKINFIMSDC